MVWSRVFATPTSPVLYSIRLRRPNRRPARRLYEKVESFCFAQCKASDVSLPERSRFRTARLRDGCRPRTSSVRPATSPFRITQELRA